MLNWSTYGYRYSLRDWALHRRDSCCFDEYTSGRTMNSIE